MGREPLRSLASGKVPTWLPWPAQCTPALKLGMQAKQTMLGSTAMLVLWGRPWAKCSESSLFDS
eukprot:1161531-Pelagomonas_calceolata.AAC.6